MLNFNINIKLYSLNELEESAREYAIESHRIFLLSEMRIEDFISGDPEYDTPEMLKESYDSEYEYYSLNDDPIIESIECNEYLFFENGEMANTCHYWKNHPEKPDQTWIKYNGHELRIK